MPIPFLATLAIQVGLTAISSLLAARNRTNVRPEPLRVDPPNPGDPIPLVFGTVKLPVKVVAHYATRWSAVKAGGRAYFGVVGPRQTVAWKPWLDAAAVLCHGPTLPLVDLIVDGKSLVAAGQSFGGGESPAGVVPYTVDLPGLLGGDERNGGIVGTLRLQYGNGQNGPDPLQVAAYGGDQAEAPDWRHYAVLYFADLNIGIGADLPPLHAVVARAPNAPVGSSLTNSTAADADEDTVGDANAAGVLWELLTDLTTGLGLPPSALDFGSFSTLSSYTASPTSDDTRIGLSFPIDRATPVEQIIADVMRVLDGTLFIHPATGKLGVWLHRDASDLTYGWDPETLLVLDPSNVRSCRLSEPEPAAILNEVRIKYVDRARGFKENVATAQNLALIGAMGHVVSETVELIGISTERMGLRLAARELRQLTTRVRRATLVCDRKPSGLHEGRVFRLVWPEYGIMADAPVTMRVASIDYGTPEDPAITLECVEDVYAVPGYEADRVITLPWENPAPPEGFIPPTVEETMSRTVSEGTLALTVTDPQVRVTSVEFRTTRGRDEPSAWTADTAPYSATVALHPRHPSTIEYRITFTVPGGSTDTIEGVASFGPGTEPNMPDIRAVWIDPPICDPPDGPIPGTLRITITNFDPEATHFRWETNPDAPFDPSGSWTGGSLIAIPPEGYITNDLGNLHCGDVIYITALVEFTEAGELVQSAVAMTEVHGGEEALPGGGGYTLPLTAEEGDLLVYRNAAWRRHPIGAEGERLVVDGGYPAWGSDGTSLNINLGELGDGTTALTTSEREFIVYFEEEGTVTGWTCGGDDGDVTLDVETAPVVDGVDFVWTTRCTTGSDQRPAFSGTAPTSVTLTGANAFALTGRTAIRITIASASGGAKVTRLAFHGTRS